MKKTYIKKHTLQLLVTITMIVVIVSAVSFVIKDGFTPDMIVHIMPKNLFLAFLFMMIFFALKSVTIFFPVTILFMCNGILFPQGISFLVSFLGLIVCRSVPYFVGNKGFQKEEMYSLLQRHPQIQRISQYQNQNTLFVCFIAYMIGLPGDLVSLYLGMSDIPYPLFIIGSVAGSLVALVIETLLGTYILSSSWMHFSILLCIRVICVILSFVIKRIIEKYY